jgi:hypothetical protein
MAGVHEDCYKCGVPLDDEVIECDKCGRKMHYECLHEYDITLPFHYCDECDLNLSDPSQDVLLLKLLMDCDARELASLERVHGLEAMQQAL